jgi:hypothetical protein
MNKGDRLDHAIDAIAARMTAVTEDDGLAERITAALPERSAWSWHWLVPRLAITAVIGLAAALVVLRSFDDGPANVLRTGVPSSPSVEQTAAIASPPSEHRTFVEPPLIVRRTIVERPQNDRRTLDAPDHERSLLALEVASALVLDSSAPESLPEDAPLTLKPLEIADLPLTADSFSPR